MKIMVINMNVLIVVDMQNDFIDGALGTKEAEKIVPKVIEKIKGFGGAVLATMDTHGEDYLNTLEGEKLPVTHCVRGTKGWEIQKDVAKLISTTPFEKNIFGSMDLAEYLIGMNKQVGIKEITLIGLCTDICVISNAIILKSALPQVKISVDSACCGGVTVESHNNALEAMKMCQINVI